MKTSVVVRAITLSLFLSTLTPAAWAQEVTLAQSESAAQTNHPLVGKSATIAQGQSAGLDAENLKYLPRLTVATKVTQQSDATQVATLTKDLTQWQVTAEASQVLFDGGAIEAQKQAVVTGADLERKQLDVSLDAVRSQVRQAYFTIILLDSQISQNRLRAKELAENRQKITAFVANGVAIQSDVDAIRVEELGAQARDAELNTNREASVFALSRLTGLTFTPESRFVRPTIPTPTGEGLSTGRKEFALFQSQEAAQEARRGALMADLLPKLSAFVQVGYGDPSLNALQADAQPWWVLGVRGTVALDNLYMFGAATQKIDAAIGKIEVDQNNFRLGEEIRLRQKQAEISRLEKLIAIDDQTIGLRTSIKTAAEAKAANGVISVTTLVREINEESLAVETKALHEVQLLAAKSELSLIIGNGE